MSTHSRERSSRHGRSGRARVGVFGRFGSDNLGNEGSADALVSFLRTNHPEARLDFLCSGPAQVRRRYGCPATNMHWFHREVPGEGLGVKLNKLARIAMGAAVDAGRTIAWVRRHDLVVVPGTGVLETTLPGRAWQTPWSLFMLCLAGRLSGVPVALLSVGASDVRQRPSRRLLRWAAQLAQYCSVRDEYSQAAVRAMGVRRRVELHPDLVFALPSPSAEVEPGTVGLGVMAFYGAGEERDRAGEIHERYLDQLQSLVRWLVDRGRAVRLFVGDPVDEQVVDAVFAHLRAARPDLPARQVCYEPVGSLDALMDQLARAEIVIGTRYHNVLGALKCARPTIALGYGVKHRDLMTRFGMAEFYQDLRDLDPAALQGQIVRLEADPGRWHRILAEHNDAVLTEAARAFTFIDDVHAPARTHTGRGRHLATRVGQA
jgi:polysaccharide pyruvyl transferase WcaK-like protein